MFFILPFKVFMIKSILNNKTYLKLEIKYTFPKVSIPGTINIVAFINFNFIL